MTAQITQLIKFIQDGDVRFYEEVEEEARMINRNWRESTWTRGLRASNRVKALYSDDKPNSPIIAYKYVKGLI